jgi:hypothetical protein
MHCVREIHSPFHDEQSRKLRSMTTTLGRDELVDRIAELARRAEFPPDLTRLNPESSRYQIMRLNQVAGITRAELDDLGGHLARHFGFDPDAHVIVWSSPNSSQGWPARSLSDRMVARARFLGASLVLAEYEDAFAANRAEIHDVVALWGLHPTQTFEVRDGIHLAPLSSLPSSPPRDLLLGIPTYLDNREEGGGFQVRARPTAALTTVVEFSPIVSSTHSAPPGRAAARHDEMVDIARCLTLVVPRPVEEIAHWSQPVEQDHPLIAGVGGWGGQEIRWNHQFLIEPEEIDPAQVRPLVDGYFALGRQDQSRLRIAFDRLSAAKREQVSLENRAVDLGVSLEALLFNPNDVPSEISFKFKMRGAVLASELPDDRKAAFKLLDRIYALRSAAAHGAVFEEDDETRASVGGDLRTGIVLADQLIQRVLILRKLPGNWNALILGWDRLTP